MRTDSLVSKPWSSRCFEYLLEGKTRVRCKFPFQGKLSLRAWRQFIEVYCTMKADHEPRATKRPGRNFEKLADGHAPPLLDLC